MSNASLPVLALSASGEGVSVALGLAGPPGLEIECWSEPPHHAASDRLLVNSDALLRGRNVSPAEIKLIAVDVGPGPFTAVRAACSMAQGLALAHGGRVISASSTEILAAQACSGLERGQHTVLVVVDARMGEWYCASLMVDTDDDGEPVSVEELRDCVVCAADQIWALAGPGSAQVTGAALRVAGNGAGVLCHPGSILDGQARAAGWSPMHCSAAVAPRSDALLKLALRRERCNAPAPANEAVPRYVRNKVALDVHEQRAAREASRRGESGVTRLSDPNH